MQMEHEPPQDEVIAALQRQIDALTENNLHLKEQLAGKEQFTAMIAHELRSPLTPIINYAHIVARPNQRRETIERGTNIIISQAWRLSRLVSDLLDSSRLTSGQFTLACNLCDAVKLVKETVEQLRPIAPYHTFIIDVPGDPLIGNWDYGRLQQALGNLLDNAIKYSPEETTITVRASLMPGKVSISVHNEGQSIPFTEVDQLFRPYSRLATNSRQKGSGLGLYIAKSIIDAHGGTLQLEPPTEEQQGTTFTFDLPLP
ncbi:MAG TPA: HAMP domain-containing sensor histidine kinase [Ktedonobacteraceae bacterium]|nr:HAMP domain-containing sensor histidine kinase [Ktedonobacteraceae bacterium]